MSLLISFPPHCQFELEWICSVLLGEFLGVEYRTKMTDDSFISIESNNRKIELFADFFNQAASKWLASSSLPIEPLSRLDIASTGLNVPLIDQPLPVLFGSPEIEINDHTIRIGIDIFGTAFFMLSRYEEAVLSDRDKFDRFPSKSSFAHRAEFLDRPIVDEYVEVLWAAMKRLWPELKRKSRHPRTLVSCDVDAPYDYSNSFLALIRRLGGDVIKRGSLGIAMNTLINNVCVWRGDNSRDPYLKAIDWIMDVNEKVGNRVAFYFITAHSHPKLDGCYNMNEPVIRDLLRHIAARGHEIGLHTSYNTYQDTAQTCREADILRQVMTEEGIQQEVIGGRQHFLRWRTPTTARNLEAAGMDYDSTLSFADRPGFRCGTCHEYPMYDLIERRVLKLRQRPLIVMECSVIAQRYMDMGYSEAGLELMKKYKHTCHRFGGNFTLLWHNSHMMTASDKRFYLELIK